MPKNLLKDLWPDSQWCSACFHSDGARIVRNHQTAIVVLLLAVGRGAVAGDGSQSPETDLAAPGAPLYEYAVTESVKSLMSKQEQAALDAQGRPPSPGPDYFWCKNCKTYHKRKAPASARQPAAARTPGAAPAASPPPDAAAAARPPSPGADYYWCDKCKTYHRRKPLAQQSVEDLILGGVTNSPSRNPLIAPAGAER